jgi:hypothetical protein
MNIKNKMKDIPGFWDQYQDVINFWREHSKALNNERKVGNPKNLKKS